VQRNRNHSGEREHRRQVERNAHAANARRMMGRMRERQNIRNENNNNAAANAARGLGRNRARQQARNNTAHAARVTRERERRPYTIIGNTRNRAPLRRIRNSAVLIARPRNANNRRPNQQQGKQRRNLPTTNNGVNGRLRLPAPPARNNNTKSKKTNKNKKSKK